jgi:GcrA cell cycle regulator
MQARREPWTEEEDATLRRLWAGGDTAGVIAQRMGRKRNGVIGRAHRLCLPSRPSPIKGVVGERKPAPKRDRVAEAAARAERRNAQPASVVVVARPAPVVARPLVALSIPCCWPIGEPRKRGFRFCQAPRYVSRSPYCATHHGVAYKSRAQPGGIRSARPAREVPPCLPSPFPPLRTGARRMPTRSAQPAGTGAGIP